MAQRAELIADPSHLQLWKSGDPVGDVGGNSRTKHCLYETTPRPIRLDGESHEKTHEAIVSLEEFMRYDDLMAHKKSQGMRGMARGSRSKDVTGAAFYGMIRCSVCSRKLATDPTKWLMRYRCRARDVVVGSASAEAHPKNVRIAELAIQAGLAEWLVGLFSPERLEATIEKIVGAETSNSPRSAQADLARKRGDVERRIGNLLDSIENGMDVSMLKPRIDAAKAELDTIDSLLVESGAPVANTPA